MPAGSASFRCDMVRLSLALLRSNYDALTADFTDWTGEDAIYSESVVWEQKREAQRAK